MSVPTVVGTGLAADPALPHRDALLDTEASRVRLRRLLGADAPDGPVTTWRVRYQPGRSLRVVQRLGDAADGSDGVLVSTRGVPADRWERMAETAGALRPASGGASTGADPAVGDAGGSPTSVAADPATSSVSWVFPRDRRLGTLPDVWARRGPARAAVGPAWSATRLVALSPEKAATLQCLDREGAVLAYAKVHPDAAAAEAAAARAAVAATTGRAQARLGPRLLAVVPDASTVVLEPVAGPLLAGLPEAALPDAMAALGVTLARLHDRDPGALPPMTRFSPASLSTAADAVSAGRPALGEAATDLAATLAATAPPSDAAPVPVHGDPSPHNALLTASGVVLVDFDEAAAGNPAADLAGVLAALRGACVLGTLDPGRAAALGARLVDGYTRHAGQPDATVLRWHIAAAVLVQGAARAVRRVQPAALARTAGLLDDALALATGRLDLDHPPTARPWRDL